MTSASKDACIDKVDVVNKYNNISQRNKNEAF